MRLLKIALLPPRDRSRRRRKIHFAQSILSKLRNCRAEGCVTPVLLISFLPFPAEGKRKSRAVAKRESVLECFDRMKRNVAGLAIQETEG